MRDVIWNLLTILAFVAALIFILIFGFMFVNPGSALNPLAPPTLPAPLTLPTSTATLKQLPQVNTATPMAVVNTAEFSATPKPSSTPLPTNTSFVLPSATITPTPTSTETSTPTASPTSSAFQCEVVSFSPMLNANYPSGGDFDGRWTIKNVGTEVWEANVDLVYRSGTKFQASRDAVDLPNAVSTGSSVEIVVDMFAPREAGTYETIWSLRKDSTYFCEVRLVIKVQ